jgi:hypothetical protein
MASVGAAVWTQQQFGYVPHTSVDGETWQFTNSGTATSNGAAGGTTVIDTNNQSGVADTWNGRYWIKMITGTCTGEWKRITDDNGTGTLTVENNGFSAQIDSGDEYQIWKSPEPVVVQDGAGAGATDATDATRTEADVGDFEYWDGYYLVPITGTRRGEKAEITAFNPATGVFTLAAGGLSGALADGDVCLLRKFIEVGDLSLPADQPYHPRPINRLNHSRSDGVVGAKAGTLSFSAQLVASNSLSASGTAAEPSVLNGLFEACGLEESVGTSATVGAGSTTTAIAVGTGSWENFEIGQMVIYNGNPRFIENLTDGGGGVDTITVTPALPVAPVDTSTLYATRMYRKSTDSDVLGCTIEVEIDGVRWTMTGCKGNLTLVDGPVMTLSFDMQVDHWICEYEAAPYLVSETPDGYTTAPAILNSDRLAWLDTTASDIKGFTATPGAVMSPKSVQGTANGINGRSGFHLTDYACSATFREIRGPTDDLDQQLRWNVRTARDVMVAYGSHANTAGIRLPVGRLIQYPMLEEGDGMQDAPNVIEAQDAGTQEDGDSTVIKVPDWSLHLS